MNQFVKNTLRNKFRMGYTYLYCKLLYFYIFLTVVAVDKLQDSGGNVTGNLEIVGATFGIILVPSIFQNQTPIKRVGKTNLIRTPAKLLLIEGCDTTDINFSNRGMVEVGPDEFKSCPTAKEIDLSQNLLTTLPTNVFESNNFLRVLNLSDNSFEELNPVWFTPFSDSLEKLDLSRNLLKVFPVSQFPEMNHLQDLLLSENHLIDIDEDTIETVSGLEQI